MPPKRKITSPLPDPPRPKSLRRSNRKVPERPSEGIRVGSPETRSALEREVLELGEMEQKLQSEALKQRLAVEDSAIIMETSRPAKRAGRTSSKMVDKVVVPNTSNGSADAKTGIDEHMGNETENGIDLDTPFMLAGRDGQIKSGRRPPPINSEMLPLPWLGRLGYACLNTYLRSANPPVFSSRTCRLSSILEHRHPLQNPDQPEHAVKNRPDKSKPADVGRGQKYVQEIGLANARDIVKMIRWNDKYGIRFMRLSSEMFPFASHDEHGYRLAPFASAVLAEAGRVAAELGHRLTMHPGQFTQIGSPRKEVVTAAIRELEYHDELLSLLKLPEQLNRDAVMIMHMGGVYGDKEATLDRFRQNYAKLSDGVKRRLVLENDDVSYSVHDLLPICEELNIPLVLDYHHHNIVFDPCLREGTLDIIGLYDRIRATWTKKQITQKMHYSEPTAAAVTPRDRRKHSARVKTLPPCARDMDLMIEAKDKEQAVFELMRTFKLPGWNRFNDIIPHERDDEPRQAVVKKGRSTKQKTEDGLPEHDGNSGDKFVDPEDIGMGGPDSRVFWPEGMEEWLRPRKREGKKSNDNGQ
ncbi:hypothetical protein RJ55_02008 [Drechmeria coniospora]|nr:hypothetical protein RJ55_02008 [Drechmeria coniospora]